MFRVIACGATCLTRSSLFSFFIYFLYTVSIFRHQTFNSSLDSFRRANASITWRTQKSIFSTRRWSHHLLQLIWPSIAPIGLLGNLMPNRPSNDTSLCKMSSPSILSNLISLQIIRHSITCPKDILGIISDLRPFIWWIISFFLWLLVFVIFQL